MKIKYNVLSIYNDTNESIVISKQFDTYDDVLEHLMRNKEANGHSYLKRQKYLMRMFLLFIIGGLPSLLSRKLNIILFSI